jgi:putative CocE/NonD family hydrolase
MMKRLLTRLALVCALLTIPLQHAPKVGAQVPGPVHEQDVVIPMRDGVRLRADVLRPPQGRVPTLVYRTPYGKHDALEEYTTFKRAVERGYAVVVQDVRGRFTSDGEFRPYENEGRDGYDTIEWAAQQPWSNGRVGTFGLSYPGAVQWLAAVENPPHLQAMVPAMTFSTPQNFFYSGGIWDLSWIAWI